MEGKKRKQKKEQTEKNVKRTITQQLNSVDCLMYFEKNYDNLKNSTLIFWSLYQRVTDFTQTDILPLVNKQQYFTQRTPAISWILDSKTNSTGQHSVAHSTPYTTHHMHISYILYSCSCSAPRGHSSQHTASSIYHTLITDDSQLIDSLNTDHGFAARGSDHSAQPAALVRVLHSTYPPDTVSRTATDSPP